MIISMFRNHLIDYISLKKAGFPFLYYNFAAEIKNKINSVMKKLFITSLLILLTGMTATAKAEIKDEINIPIRNNEGELIGKPKAPERIHIDCQYVDGCLFFGFYYDLGNVNVIVTNEVTGEQWNAVLQTSSIAFMNISDSAGSYHIEITTIYNKVYYGDFEINY